MKLRGVVLLGSEEDGRKAWSRQFSKFFQCRSINERKRKRKRRKEKISKASRSRLTLGSRRSNFERDGFPHFTLCYPVRVRIYIYYTVIRRSSWDFVPLFESSFRLKRFNLWFWKGRGFWREEGLVCFLDRIFRGIRLIVK